MDTLSAYMKPLVQQLALGSKELPQNTSSRQLMNLKKSAEILINSRIARRIHPNPVLTINDVQVACMADTVLFAIDSAAALDLDKRLRPSGNNVGN